MEKQIILHFLMQHLLSIPSLIIFILIFETLKSGVAPNKLMLINPRDQMGETATNKMIEMDYKVVKSAFYASSLKEKLQIKSWDDQQSVEDIFSEWLK